MTGKYSNVVVSSCSAAPAGSCCVCQAAARGKQGYLRPFKLPAPLRFVTWRLCLAAAVRCHGRAAAVSQPADDTSRVLEVHVQDAAVHVDNRVVCQRRYLHGRFTVGSSICGHIVCCRHQRWLATMVIWPTYHYCADVVRRRLRSESSAIPRWRNVSRCGGRAKRRHLHVTAS